MHTQLHLRLGSGLDLHYDNSRVIASPNTHTHICTNMHVRRITIMPQITIKTSVKPTNQQSREVDGLDLW
jgi:hypothetical protein